MNVQLQVCVLVKSKRTSFLRKRWIDTVLQVLLGRTFRAEIYLRDLVCRLYFEELNLLKLR